MRALSDDRGRGLIPIMLVMGKILDAVDHDASPAHQMVLLLLIDRLVVEGGGVQQQFDFGGQGIALGR